MYSYLSDKEKVANYLMIFFSLTEIIFIIYLKIVNKLLYNGMIDVRNFSFDVALNLVIIAKTRHSIRKESFKSFVIIQPLILMYIIGSWFVYQPNYTFNEAKQIVETDYNKKYLVEELSERNKAISYYYIIKLSNEDPVYLFHPVDGVYRRQ